MVDKLWVATKAFIVYNGKVLIIRESTKYVDGANPNKYDVVGGRIEPGQRFDDSLRREIREETGLEVSIGRAFHIDEWRPVVRGEQWQIVGTYIECFAETDQVTLSQDHDDFQWIDAAEYKKYVLYDGIEKAFEAYLAK
jgi:8-oxo-dGTP diphosphatase